MAQLEFESITYNAKGLGDECKRKKIFNYMKKKTSSSALVMIQEDSRELQYQLQLKMNWSIKYFPQLWLIVMEDILSFVLR